MSRATYLLRALLIVAAAAAFGYQLAEWSAGCPTTQGGC